MVGDVDCTMLLDAFVVSLLPPKGAGSGILTPWLLGDVSLMLGIGRCIAGTPD
jgi:hypothetical protein